MSELTDRMRTCAAAIEASKKGSVWDLALVANDAISLLSQAADLLDRPEPPELLKVPELLGPMPAAPPPQALDGEVLPPMWVGTDLPPPAPLRCPSCGAVTARTVKRIARSRTVALICPVCSHQWELA